MYSGRESLLTENTRCTFDLASICSDLARWIRLMAWTASRPDFFFERGALASSSATIHYEQCDVNKEPSGCGIDMEFNVLYEKAAAKAISR